METATIIGFAAAACSTVSFVPQAVQIIKSRDTRSISAATYAITVIGFALWLVFGLLKIEWPLILTNAVCLLLAGFILAMKLMPQSAKNNVADTLDPKV
jgi:MtN3 and saliva related transmembrane protein